MKKFILTLVAGLLLSLHAFTQSTDLSEQEKKDINKVVKLSEKKKYAEAIDLLEPIVMDHKKNKELWTGLCQLYGEKYKNAPPALTITTKSKDKEVNKLVQQMMLMLGGSAERRQYINIMRKATLMCGGLEEVGALLRINVIDSRYEVDTDISEKGKKYFNMAEGYFGQRDMSNAIKYYKKALDSDPNYYKAYLYLGDAYYLNKNYDDAETIFEECADSFPYLVEPIKYYYDAMYKQEDYKKAYELAIRGLIVCPDIGMQLKFEDVCTKLDKTYKQHWISRNNFPNKIRGTNSEVQSEPWSFYREALDKVKEYTDTITGVLRPNTFTKCKYMEEYCWSYMLEKADKSKFEFARQMQEKGMLDCYVLFSLFHVDLYDQFRDLAKTNPQKLKKYIEEELVK